MIFMNKIYLQHYNRGDEICPLCQAPLKWRKIGERKWVPCDSIPVLFRFLEGGKERVIFKGDLVTGVEILRPGNAVHFLNQKTYYGLEPHVFTCKVRERFTAFQRK